jgi:hypothetical protein
MAIEYTVSQDGLRIETYPNGVLDFKKTINYFNKLKNEQRIKQGAIEIVYFKHVTDFNISYLESIKITESYQTPKATQLINKTIFVCKTDLEYGMGNMLRTLHKITNPNHKVEVVRSESELENAIKS